MTNVEFYKWLNAHGINERSVVEVRFTLDSVEDPDAVQFEVVSYLLRDESTAVPGHAGKGVGSFEGRYSQGKFGVPKITTRHILKSLPGTPPE